ncbi:secA DEAD-like domain protein, partial [Chlamydia psittaci 84-8471/1]
YFETKSYRTYSFKCEKPCSRSRDYCSSRKARSCDGSHQYGWSWYRY